MLTKDAKILIVDDSKVVRASVRKFLRELGYEGVTEAEDGAKAVLLHAAGKFDVILMDVVMPNLTGDQALAKIRATDKTTPVIMLTSVVSGDQIQACKDLGIFEFIVKPLTMGGGADRLKEVFARM